MNLGRAYVFVGLAALLWGSTAAITKLLLSHLDNLQVLMITTLVASLTFAALTVVQGKVKILRSHTRRDFAILAGLGLLGIFMYQLLLQGALTLMPAQEAFVVNYTWPIMVVLFAALLLHERLTALDVVAVIVAFLGVVLVVSRGSFNSLAFSPWGIAMALGAAATYGLFSVLGKRRDLELVTSMLVYSACSFACALVAVLLFSHMPSLSPGQLTGLIWLGVGPYGLAYMFWFLALRSGSTPGMSSAIFITPFLSAIYVWWLLNEPVAWYSMLGLIVIVSGVLLQASGGWKRNDPAQTAAV